MFEQILIIPILFSFFVTFFMIPFWIKKTQEIGLVGKDMQKLGEKKVSEAGGICVVAGFILGVLIYIAIKTFYFKSETNLILIFSLMSTILIVTIIGLIDDLLGWKKGLSKRIRLFWVFVAAIPLMVINAGESQINFPFFDGINLGLIYPLIIIPLGIIGASTTFNFLAGYNGLEAGMGILILSSLSFYSWINGVSWLSLIGLCMISSLIAFLIYNKYPAKIFPGDVLTYSVGAMIAIMAILGNFERFALFVFIPYFLEIFLKIRGKLKKESFSNVNEDGSLELKYEKFYSITHIMLWLIKKIKPNHKVYEYEIVFGVLFLELVIIILAFVIFL